MTEIVIIARGGGGGLVNSFYYCFFKKGRVNDFLLDGSLGVFPFAPPTVYCFFKNGRVNDFLLDGSLDVFPLVMTSGGGSSGLSGKTRRPDAPGGDASSNACLGGDVGCFNDVFSREDGPEDGTEGKHIPGFTIDVFFSLSGVVSLSMRGCLTTGSSGWSGGMLISRSWRGSMIGFSFRDPASRLQNQSLSSHFVESATVMCRSMLGIRVSRWIITGTNFLLREPEIRNVISYGIRI